MSQRPVELVNGPYRAGKTEALLGRIIDHCSAYGLNAAAVITVPSHRYKKLLEQRLHARMQASGLPGFTGLKILPFYDLCHHVLRQCGHTFRMVPDQLRPAILVRAIERVKAAGSLICLKSIAGFAGTHKGLLELIDELERAGLSPSEVLSVLSKQAASDARFMELAAIYQSYWQELETLGIFDERKLAYKSREVVGNLDEGALGIGLLAVDGFDRFNKLQVQVLAALTAQARMTVINFDYVSDDDNYSWKEKSYRDLTAALGRDVKVVQTAAKSTLNSPAPIEMARSLDRFMEMEEVARGVKQCLAQGALPSEIIVVARSIKPYMSAIRAAFESAALGYFLDEPIELTSLPLINYLLRLLSLPLPGSDFVRQDTIRVLASPFFNRLFLGLDERQIEDIDNQSIDKLTVKGEADWSWSPSVSRLISRLKLVQTADITEYVRLVEDIIDDLLVLPSDEEYADPLVTWEEHQALFEFRRVLGNLVLEETLLASAYGPVVLSYSEFYRRLEHAVEAANFRRPSPDGAVLTICSADLVPNKRYSKMFIVGLNEGEFPRRSEQSGFLSRDEVRKWLGFGIDLENPRHHESFEPSLYNSLLERVLDNVYLSSAMYEMGGEELIPSFFLTRGDEARAREIKLLTPRRNALIKPTSAQELSAAFLWSLGYEALGLKEMLPQEGRDFLQALELPLATVVARTRAEAGNFNEYNGNLREHVRFGNLTSSLPDTWSVSKLNDYGKCPFRYWVSHTLEIKPLEEPETGLNARLIGEVYHKILEIFYSRLGQSGQSLRGLDSTNVAAVEGIFAESIKEGFSWLEGTGRFKRGEFWEYEKKDLVFRLNRFLRKEKERALGKYSDYTPTYFERSFGGAKEGAAPLLVLEYPSNLDSGEDEFSVRLRGQVDRIDCCDGLVRVVDYKSGSSRIGKEESLSGRNMQLAVYAMAVSKSILPGRKVTGGCYLSISSGEVIGKLDFAEQADPDEDYMERAREKIGQFVRSVKAGNFQVEPSADSSCNHCDHAQICRVGELPTSATRREEAEFDAD